MNGMDDHTPDLASGPPPSARIEGASFSLVMKGLATALMAAMAWGAWQALQAGAWAPWSNSTRLFLGMVTLVILSGYWGILSSRTSVDGQCIRQSWLWHKEVRLADITQLKLIHVPGLGWLIAPRLVVRSGALGLTTFHVADPKVLAALKRLAYG